MLPPLRTGVELERRSFRTTFRLATDPPRRPTRPRRITNRYWISCFDEPDQRQSTEIIVTAPAGFEAVSIGKLIERKNIPDQTTSFHWVQGKPHPSYCVTMIVRQFDVVHDEWEGIQVDYYLPKGQKALAQPTFGRTREMLAFFSERFGVRYP
jgi:aminopeptidase N